MPATCEASHRPGRSWRPASPGSCRRSWLLATLALTASLVAFGAGCDLEREKARRALRSGSPGLRVQAVRRLGELREVGELPAILRAAEDPSPPVRRAAVAALGAIGDLRALPALVRCSRDRDTEVRLAAVSVLGDFGQGSARGPLLAALSDGSLLVRRRARSALQGLGMSATEQVRRLAGERRQALLGELRAPLPSLRRAAAEQLGESGDASAVPALVVAMRDPDPEVAIEAARALGQVGGAAALAELGRAADPNDPLRPAVPAAVAEAGVQVLLESGDCRDGLACGLASRSLTSAAVTLRRAAALCLARRGSRGATARTVTPATTVDAATTARLLRLLRDPEPGSALAAAEAMRSLGLAVDQAALLAELEAVAAAEVVVALAEQVPLQVARELDRRLAERLARVDTVEPRLAAAVSRLRQPSSTRALIARVAADFASYQEERERWLDEDDWRGLEAGAAAAGTPAASGGATTVSSGAATAISQPAPAAAAAAGGASGGRVALERLLGRFPERSPEGEPRLFPPRRTDAQLLPLLTALRGLGGAWQLLSRVAASTDGALRAEALRGLWAIEVGDGAAAADHAALVARLVAELRQPRAEVRLAAVEGLGRVGRPARSALVGVLLGEDSELRAAAATALGRIPGQASSEALLSALRREPQVEVIEALGTLGAREAAEPLLALLREDSPPGQESERVAVIVALSRLGEARVASALADDLDHPAASVRRAAAAGLGRLLRGTPATAVAPRVREALRSRREDFDAGVRQACSLALASPEPVGN